MARFTPIHVLATRRDGSGWLETDSRLFLNLAWVKTVENVHDEALNRDELILTYWNNDQISVAADERLLGVLSDG